MKLVARTVARISEVIVYRLFERASCVFLGKNAGASSPHGAILVHLTVGTRVFLGKTGG